MTTKIKLSKMLDSGEMVDIVVEIDPSGAMTALVEGVAGPSCSEISAFLDQMGIVTSDEATSDFYQMETVQSMELTQ